MDTFTKEKVAKHNSKSSCWIIINNLVYDVTNFLKDHPGGESILVSMGGKESTETFEMFHKLSVLDKHGKKYIIGEILA